MKIVFGIFQIISIDEINQKVVLIKRFGAFTHKLRANECLIEVVRENEKKMH